MTNLSYIYNPHLLKPESELVWDYRNGYIIDSATGEVVGEILYADHTMGFENSLENEERFVHYNVLRSYIDLTSYQRRVWGYAWEYIKSRGYDVDPYVLAKVVRLVYGVKANAPVDAKAVATIVVALRMHGYSIDVEKVCQENGLSREECGKVFEILRELIKSGVRIPAENRYEKIMNLIQQFPDKEVASLAVRLLKYAKIDGKPTTSVVATLIYVAGLLLDKGITMKDLAKLYEVSEVRIRNNYKGKILPIMVRLTNANVAEAIYVPKKICKDLEDFKLSQKVVCV